MSVPATEAPRRSAAVGEPDIVRLPRWFSDHHGWVAAALYLLVMLWYEHPVIEHLGSACSCANTDPTQWMWSWKWIPYALTHGQNPFVTHRIWTATGFDLAAATLAPVSAIPGVPLTALFGPIVAYNLLMIVAPVLNGWAAYRLCRYVSGAPWASVLAGFTYAFSAYDLGHLLGHIHLMFIFVPPLLVLEVLRHLDGETSRRRATTMVAILVLIELGLSTEILFDMTLIGMVSLGCAYLLIPPRRRQLMQAGAVLLVAYAVAVAISAFYIYEELKGPSESKGSVVGNPSDLLSYLFPTQMFRVGGNAFLPLSRTFFTNNPFEQNSYLGLPLCAIVIAFAVDSWRLVSTRIIILSTLVAFLLALGATLTVAGNSTVHLPFSVLDKLPLFDLTLPPRFGAFVALGAALACAKWISQAGARAKRTRRWLLGCAALVFLIPNGAFPNRINTYDQAAFFTTNLYRSYLQPNEVVMTIPFGWSGDEMLWQADTGMFFRLAGGYFGTPPPSDLANPLVNQLFYDQAAPPRAQEVRELRSYVGADHVGAVLIPDGQAGPWLSVLAGVGFKLKADAGGIEVFTPGNGPS